MAQKQPQLTMAQAHQHYLNYLALAREGREADGMASLMLAGDAAHPGALFSLAANELQGLDGERNVKSATAKLLAAARQGHSRARQTLAVMRAIGIGGTANWSEAIAIVIRSARVGDVSAMRDLGFLIEMAAPSHILSSELLLRAARADDVLAVLAVVKRASAGKVQVPDDELSFWTHALQRVKHPLAMRLPRVAAPPQASRKPVTMPPLDERAWSETAALLARMPGEDLGAAMQISSDPKIFEFKNLLSEEECDYLVGLAAPLLTQAKIYNPITGTTQMNSVRTASEAPFWLTNQNMTVHCLNARMAKAAGLRLENGETLNILMYGQGDEYRPHFDFFSENVQSIPDFAKSGQRIRTLLTYLNDDFIAGQTHFLNADLKYRGRVGDAILFLNVLEDGSPDRTTKHAGLPVEQGVKWLASKWFRERSYWS
jgi:prolyl 4-hydroxylase